MNFPTKKFWQIRTLLGLGFLIAVVCMMAGIASVLEQANSERERFDAQLIRTIQGAPLAVKADKLTKLLDREDTPEEDEQKVIYAWAHAYYGALRAKGPIEAILLDNSADTSLDLKNPQEYQRRMDEAMSAAQVWHDFVENPGDAIRFNVSAGSGTLENVEPDIVITEQVEHNILGRKVLEPKHETHFTYNQIARLTALNTAEETRGINSRLVSASVQQ